MSKYNKITALYSRLSVGDKDYTSGIGLFLRFSIFV
jgi:hypothetical protein